MTANERIVPTLKPRVKWPIRWSVPDLFLDSVWPGLVAWVILYCSDYILTVVCARLYAAGARDKIVFEGSYEITPYYQRDIDSLRRVSPRFLAALVLSSLWLLATWWLSTQSWPLMYAFALGAVILPELAVHVRHIRNFLLFRALVRTDEVRGRLEYSRPLMLRLSSLELLTFSGLFAVLFLFTGSVFILGGTMTCTSLAVQHWRLARAHSAGKPSNAPLHTATGSADSG